MKTGLVILLAALATINDPDKLTFWSGPGTFTQPAGEPPRMSTGSAGTADWLTETVPPPESTPVYDVAIHFSAARPSNPRGPSRHARGRNS